MLFKFGKVVSYFFPILNVYAVFPTGEYSLKQGFHWAFNYVHIYLGASIFLTSD